MLKGGIARRIPMLGMIPYLISPALPQADPIVHGNFGNPSQLSVAWDGQVLSVIARKAPLHEVLEAISEKTGMRITGADRLLQPVDVNVSRVDLAQAVRYLLRDVDYAFADGFSGGGAALVVVGRRLVSPQEHHAAVSRPDTTYAQSTEDSGPDAAQLQRYQAIESATGTGNVEALRSYILDPDPSVRASAMEGLILAYRGADSTGKLAIVQQLPHTSESVRLLTEASLESDESVKNAATSLLSELQSQAPSNP